MSVYQLSLVILLSWLSIASAQNSGEKSPPTDQPVAASAALRVGIREAPPFAVKNEAGGWEGISVSLWQTIANDLGLAYRFEERSLEGLLAGVGDGSLDAAVGALTITAAREVRFDFTHTFFQTGLGVAVRRSSGVGFLHTLQRLLRGGLLHSLGIIVLCLLVFTLLIWLFERQLLNRHPEQLGRARASMGSSLWWSLVILIGKNDSHPVSLCGRILAWLWMLVSLVIVSSVTAVITSALTVNELQHNITSLSDLSAVRLLSIPHSSSAEFLDRERIRFHPVPDIAHGLAQITSLQADALIYDKPLLRYAITKELMDELEVLALTFEPQNYAFALPDESPWLETVNQRLLVHIRTPAWETLLAQYLGQ